jgi:hypothetical protein
VGRVTKCVRLSGETSRSLLAGLPTKITTSIILRGHYAWLLQEEFVKIFGGFTQERGEPSLRIATPESGSTLVPRFSTAIIGSKTLLSITQIVQRFHLRYTSCLSGSSCPSTIRPIDLEQSLPPDTRVRVRETPPTPNTSSTTGRVASFVHI